MEFYIPYIASSSFALLLSKGYYNYMYSDKIEEPLDNNIDNEFLTEHLDIIDKDIVLDSLEDNDEDKTPIPEFLNDEEDVPFPEIVQQKHTEESKKSVTFADDNKELTECIKCKAKLPNKCFSKSQKKKPSHVWKCKVCTKLQ
jgi:hypothetical protein